MFVDINAAGCPDTCRHCSVDGHLPYGKLFSLDELRAIKNVWGPLTIRYEPTAHPDFPEIFAPDISGDCGGWLVTNGFGLAERDDFQRVFEKMRAMAFNTLAFTLHGLREHHDWFVCRDAAFDTIVLATRRARDAGFSTRWQIFVDRKGIDSVPELVDIAQRETGGLPNLGLPYHRVGGRLAHYEKIRLRLRDVEAHRLNQLIDDPRLNDFIQSESLTSRAWLEKWLESPAVDDFKHPFEPRSWPPEASFEMLSLRIGRDQKIYLDPLASAPIFLGKVSDGRELIIKRLESLPMPTFVDLDPREVCLPTDEEDILHPHGYSFRYREISRKRLAM